MTGGGLLSFTALTPYHQAAEMHLVMIAPNVRCDAEALSPITTHHMMLSKLWRTI